jgi:hypothetical protein
MMRWIVRLSLMSVFTIVTALAAAEDRWWPVQALPKAIVRTEDWQRFPAPNGAYQTMVQSVAGLAAKAVNEGRGDELVWVGTGHVDLEHWYDRLLVRRPQLEVRGTLRPWELVDRYVKRGIIKGYILYTWDESPGELCMFRQGMDCSVNVATSLAGVLDGILVEQRLEKEAMSRGLKMLSDARRKTQQWCFDTYKQHLNRRLLCAQDPKIALARDMAIAHKAFTVYGPDEPLRTAMQWLEPLSPILGWSGGNDEFQATRLSSIYGHVQTATNWTINLPVLMAGTEQEDLPTLKRFDPRTINFRDRRSAVSFVSTDGDNVGWFQAGFFRLYKDYWPSPDRGRIAFGWSCCFTQLAQLCPRAFDYVQATRTDNDWFIEWGGGYYYPDLFAIERANRWDLLAEYARRTWAMMKKTDTRIIGFNFSRYDTPDALKAYEVFAKQTDGLLGILVFQYTPYEAGAGKTFWVKDRDGVEIPVVTARYSIWEHTNQNPRSGTPAKVAREIRDTVSAAASGSPRYDWVIAHAWSYFRRAPGVNEDAENMEQKDAATRGGVRGCSPVVWCAERLPADIRVVCPEELLWRIRMQHNPEQTRRLISTPLR